MTIDYEYYQTHKQEIFDIYCMIIEEFQEKQLEMIEEEIKKSLDGFVTSKQLMVGDLVDMDKILKLK